MDYKDKLERTLSDIKENHRTSALIVSFVLFFSFFYLGVSSYAILIPFSFIFFAFFLYFLFETKEELSDLFVQRRHLLRSMKSLEKKYLSQKISKKEFDELMEEYLSLFSDVEAKIRVEIGRKSGSDEKSLKVATRYFKKEVEDLLKEKEIVLESIKILTEKYMKREISQKTYNTLLAEKKKRLNEIENELENLYAEEKIKEIFEKIKDLHKSEKASSKKTSRKKTNKKTDNTNVILEDILDQIKEEEKKQ